MRVCVCVCGWMVLFVLSMLNGDDAVVAPDLPLVEKTTHVQRVIYTE